MHHYLTSAVEPDAATATGANYSYTYDNNGNMLTRWEGTVTDTFTGQLSEEERRKAWPGWTPSPCALRASKLSLSRLQ